MSDRPKPPPYKPTLSPLGTPLRERKCVTESPYTKLYPRGIWHADLAKLNSHYPKTPEAYAKRQASALEMNRKKLERGHDPLALTRAGVPDGWGGMGRRKRLFEIREKAEIEAKDIVMEMKSSGLIEGEDPRGDEAIEWAVAILRAKDTDGKSAYSINTKLEAAKLVAQYCKVKPVSRVQNKIEAAEDFLALLAQRPE